MRKVRALCKLLTRWEWPNCDNMQSSHEYSMGLWWCRKHTSQLISNTQRMGRMSLQKASTAAVALKPAELRKVTVHGHRGSSHSRKTLWIKPGLQWCNLMSTLTAYFKGVDFMLRELYLNILFNIQY